MFSPSAPPSSKFSDCFRHVLLPRGGILKASEGKLVLLTPLRASDLSSVVLVLPRPRHWQDLVGELRHLLSFLKFLDFF